MTHLLPDAFSRAIVRRPGPELVNGLTSHRGLRVDPVQALVQHEAYVKALTSLGVAVTVLPPLPGFPDACFVEDTAVVVPGCAVITRPGAPSRRGETATVAEVLARMVPVVTMDAPATLDGGDVLVVGDVGWIGLSDRTNAAGAAFLTEALSHHGVRMTTVPVAEGLHLKSSVNWVGGRRLLAAAPFAGHPAFADWEVMPVPPDEAYACNTLRVAGTLIAPAGHPATRDLLAATGDPVVELATDEIAKVDGGLTCLSLRLV